MPISDALSDPQMAVAPNAAEIYAFVVENAPGTLKRVTLGNGHVITVTTGLTYPLDLALGPDETTAYVTQFDGALVAVNLSSGSLTTVTTALQHPSDVALSADGKTTCVAEHREGHCAR
jgi:DNA-binding beta-propeller fold protein YncE